MSKCCIHAGHAHCFMSALTEENIHFFFSLYFLSFFFPPSFFFSGLRVLFNDYYQHLAFFQYRGKKNKKIIII